MKDVFKQIAKEEGISVKEVKSEIASAIKFADRSATPQGRGMWKELSPKGEEVSVEDLILYCAKLVNENVRKSRD